MASDVNNARNLPKQKIVIHCANLTTAALMTMHILTGTVLVKPALKVLSETCMIESHVFQWIIIIMVLVVKETRRCTRQTAEIAGHVSLIPVLKISTRGAGLMNANQTKSWHGKVPAPHAVITKFLTRHEESAMINKHSHYNWTLRCKRKKSLQSNQKLKVLLMKSNLNNMKVLKIEILMCSCLSSLWPVY